MAHILYRFLHKPAKNHIYDKLCLCAKNGYFEPFVMTQSNQTWKCCDRHQLTERTLTKDIKKAKNDFRSIVLMTQSVINIANHFLLVYILPWLAYSQEYFNKKLKMNYLF